MSSPSQRTAPSVGFAYYQSAVEHLLERHYRSCNRPLRRCHPRDILLQVHNYCVYNELPMEMRPDYLDGAVTNYFTVVD